jgi:hypothetical protein
VADSLANTLRISAQVDKRMHNDAARFNGIEQAKASGRAPKARCQLEPGASPQEFDHIKNKRWKRVSTGLENRTGVGSESRFQR